MRSSKARIAPSADYAHDPRVVRAQLFLYREKFLDDGETPRRLHHPIVFVLPDAERWMDLVEADPVPLPGEVHARFERGADAWTIVSYLVLKGRGHAVELSSTMLPDRICVAHRDSVIRRELPFDSYIVAVRADRGPVWIGDWQIVQNSILEQGRSHYLPYWPQPGLLARNPARGTRIERVGFMGRERNLGEPFRNDSFRRHLSDMGMELVVRTERGEWNDYRELDAILAVREGNPLWLSTKPASKLVNSWHAACPAILGPELAYDDVGDSERDFLTVRSPEQAIDALLSLRDPIRYQRLVEHGRTRAQEFTIPAVARHWEAFLAEQVSPAYERWRRGSAVLRRPIRLVRFAWRCALSRHAPNPYRR
jgi:hypothetical protein